MSGKTEKCYSVISDNDYNRYQPGYHQSSESKATSEIVEAYYVHDDKQLHFEVDDEGAQYITQRPQKGQEEEPQEGQEEEPQEGPSGKINSVRGTLDTN